MTAEPPRAWIAVEPAARIRTFRRGARVLLIDDRDRLLMFEDRDPLLPGTVWWLTPGGGVDAGESDIEAAVREVAEETGCVITAADVQGPISHQVAVHGYADRIVEQDEVFFIVRVAAFEVDVAGHTEEEQLTMLRYHWFTHDELRQTTDWVWPSQLADLWDLQDQPVRWPLELGEQEQSTVPIR